MTSSNVHEKRQTSSRTNEGKNAMKKNSLLSIIAFAFALALVTGVQAQAETLKTRIGDLSFSHDFGIGYPNNARVE